MIDPEWKRICGFHVDQSGDMAAVWLAYDKDTDTTHMYDACRFLKQTPLVVSDGLIARGRHIPIAWPHKHKAVADELLNRGCRMLPEPVHPDEAWTMAVVNQWKGMRDTGRFKVAASLKNWQDEYQKYIRVASSADINEFPLMAATVNAIANLKRARGRPKPRTDRRAPRIAIV